jgi:ubiquinone/menaquinone biosynthesis C-methylase UbiE/uncharacterized protein YbaR (Trm112 family)
MQSAVVPYLRCPVCHSPFRLEVVSKSGDGVNTGSLVCRTCQGVYPVFHGRPILITSDSICTWKAPIDEIFGRRRLKVHPGPLSIDRVARMGDKKAIERASTVLPLRAHGSTPIHRQEDMKRKLRQVENQAKYRMWGNWMYSKGRDEAFMKALSEPGDAVNVFIDEVLQEKPSSLLDIMSGGGSGITSIANATDDIKYIFALDRDLKCLWSLQRKFMELGKNNSCEAVGGDVRRLPFTSESISVVTSVMGLQELYSIGLMMREVARVLVGGGCYILLYRPEPTTYGQMSVRSYSRFAKAVDMFSGHKDLMKTAVESGFVIETSALLSEEGEDVRLTQLRKPV